MIAPPSLDLSVVGNGAIAALIDRAGAIVWMGWPRIDGDPIFAALVDGATPTKGFFSIELADQDGMTSAQSYLRNTAIVRTVLTTRDGASVTITDFAPRFIQHGRRFRPPMIIRRIEPGAGLCRIRIRLRPTFEYGARDAPGVGGSNHVRFAVGDDDMRVTTDAAVTRLLDESPFVVNRPLTLILHTNETLEESPSRIGRDFQERTSEYWLNWVRQLSVPYEWQEAVIRAAITLKLCSFEETGGIVAALTTSIPEAPGSARNWDYRYCWLRDSYFTVHALNRVGATATMERYIDYVTNVIALERGPTLQPLYSILAETPGEEREAPALKGYRGLAPVRVGNAAGEQEQHDVFGSVILAAAQMFFDERLPKRGDEALFNMLEPLGMRALERALTPDAGIWEYRGRTRVHTHSAALCWAACDRLARIARRLGLDDRARTWRTSADRLRHDILARAWNEEIHCFAGSLGGDEIDASALLLHEIGLVSPQDPRFVASVETFGRRLGQGALLRRYAEADDFGVPTVAFLSCGFWYVDALAAIGRVEEARALFEDLLQRRNHVGLLSEDLDPQSGELWGNFPQTYSMAGLIVAAMRLSRGWEEAR